MELQLWRVEKTVRPQNRSLLVSHQVVPNTHRRAGITIMDTYKHGAMHANTLGNR